MANKLAGQRAKFSRARAIFYSTAEEAQRQRTARLMAEVLAGAPANGLTEDEVIQNEDVPHDVRQLSGRIPKEVPIADDDPDQLVAELQTTVDTSEALEIG